MTVDSDSLSQQKIIWNGSSSITNRTETEYQPSAGISKRVTVTKADGTKSISEYENGLLVRMIEKDANGGIVTQTSYGYDSYGRQNTITDLRNGTTTVTYDAADRVVTTTDPLSQSTTNHYDILGRVWKVDYPDGGSLTNVYDAKGNLALSYGSRQFPVGYGYDRLGRVTSMTNWTEYPGSGARVTTWTYSNRGFLERKTYPNQDSVAYTYTPGGRIEKKMIQTPFGSGFTNHVINLYNYNTTGDLKSVSYSGLTPGITNTYNRLGLLEGIVQGTNTTTRSYDHAGQLLSETYTGGTLNGFSVEYSYDSLMRLSQLRVSGVLTNAYSYDTAGRVSSLSNGNYSAHYSYMTNSPLISSVIHKQGSTARLTATMDYDQLNRMTNILSTPSGSTNVFEYTSLYNAVSQRTKTTLADDSYWDYTYDDLGQVTSGRRYTAAGTQISGKQSAYELDEIGNRVTSSTPGYVPYTVNDDNQYTVMKDVSLTYDPAGNLLTNGSWTYSWDNENRLTQVVSTSKLIKFSYDTQGRRIEKKVWNNTTGTGTPTTYLKYIYDGWNLIAELNGNSSDAKVRSYTWGLDISGSTTEAGGVGGLLFIDDNTNGVHFVSYDLNGNVMGLVKATNGTVSASYEYGPFGELLVSTGTMASSNPFRFSTKYRDNETDLYYYGYRYYSPSLGRWISRDPVEEQGGLNLYGFVNNDPVNKWDLLGMLQDERINPEVLIISSSEHKCVFSYNFGIDDGKWEKFGDWLHGPGSLPEKILWPKSSRNMKWVETITDVEKDLEQQMKKRNCCCISTIYFTAHSGKSGHLSLGKNGNSNIMFLSSYIDGRFRVQTDKDITISKSFFDKISSKMCKDGEIVFVECSVGSGDEGNIMKKWFEKTYGPNVKFKLFPCEVKWNWGSPVTKHH